MHQVVSACTATSNVYCYVDDQTDELGIKPNEGSRDVQVLMPSQGIKLVLCTCIHVLILYCSTYCHGTLSCRLVSKYTDMP